MAQLRQHGAVYELHHRVHDALRVDDHVHARHRHVEEPARLDHLQPLVEQRGRVDGNLAAHIPGGVFECLRGRGGGDLPAGRLPERAARSGQNQPPHGGRVAAFEALENGVVFAVHG